MTTPDELEQAVERLNEIADDLEAYEMPASPGARVASDIRALLSERAELLAAVKRMRGALKSAAETLDHVDGALMDMADAGAVPAVGTWRFVTQSAKRARAALTTGESNHKDRP